MRLLLDTHVFLWHLTDDPLLPPRFEAEILDPANEVYLSVAAVWEAVVKYYIGKLPLPGPPETFLPMQREASGIATLPIDEGVMPHLGGLPQIHRDLFDRVMIAQALQHGLTFVTVDPLVKAYAVATLA